MVQFVTGDRAVAKDYLSLGVRGKVDVVCDEHKRYSAAPVEVGHQLEDMLAVLRIQIAGRLVGEQDLRARWQKRVRWRRAAARRRKARPGNGVRDLSDPTSSASCAPAARRLEAEDLHRDQNIFVRRQARDQVKRLENKTDLAAADMRRAASSLILVISSPSMKISPDVGASRPAISPAASICRCPKPR